MRGTRSAVRKLSPRRMPKITFWRSNILDHRFNRNRVRKITNDLKVIRSRAHVTPVKALATVGITYFTRQFIARRRLSEFPSLELDEDEDTEYIDN